ncbi:hypothetical protein CO2235_U960010 [Cupriavidus oxalaticus]|uniref:Uncharacterized protein n=1 Tax=Cupriavidus oxalaticus TaxID=96344 RepID=A0A375FSV6_9BURK|nr:hypothetical protein CO2235_U960010 [Cupriavidus oxalaticus]
MRLAPPPQRAAAPGCRPVSGQFCPFLNKARAVWHRPFATRDHDPFGSFLSPVGGVCLRHCVTYKNVQHSVKCR